MMVGLHVRLRELIAPAMLLFNLCDPYVNTDEVAIIFFNVPDEGSEALRY